MKFDEVVELSDIKLKLRRRRTMNPFFYNRSSKRTIQIVLV